MPALAPMERPAGGVGMLVVWGVVAVVGGTLVRELVRLFGCMLLGGGLDVLYCGLGV